MEEERKNALEMEEEAKEAHEAGAEAQSRRALSLAYIRYTIHAYGLRRQTHRGEPGQQGRA